MKLIHSVASTTLLALFLAVPVRSLRAETGDMPDPQKMHERMEEREGKRLEMMTKKLNLTAEQQSTVKAALDDQKTKMEALRKESAERWKSVHEATEQKIDAVLTADQKKKYAAMKSEMKDKMKEHHMQHMGDGKPANEGSEK